MEYRALGRTGAQVSRLCLGCMNFGWGTEEQESSEIIHRALDIGLNFLDTADVYGKGASEEITGRAIKGRRDEVFLATKGFNRMGEGPNDWGASRIHIMRAVEDSLRRLQVEHIDLYQMHRPQSGVPIDETLHALDDLIRAGKIRYIGTSTYGAWQLVESFWQSEKLGLNRFVCEQPPYNLLDRRIEREMLPVAKLYGVAIIPWSPLAGGMLSGKYRRDEPNPHGSRYESGKFRNGEAVPEPAWKIIEGVRALAEEKGVEMDALALAWVASRPEVTSPIIGPRTMQQFEANLAALQVQISAEDERRLDELSPPGGHAAEYYNSDFGGPSSR